MQQGNAQAGSATSGTYVYCVMQTESAPSESTALGSAIDGSTSLRTVRENGLTALVSDAMRPEYEPSRANIGVHERVVREAFERGDVLPMRFGTVARDDGSVEGFLREKHEDLAKSLEELHGRAELALKVSWVDRDAILREILEEDEVLRSLRDEIFARPEAETHDERVELGRRTLDIVEQKRKAEGDRILERLQEKAIDVDVNRLLSETMVLNASFLIDRNAIATFDDAVNTVGAEQSGRMTLKYVGPLPPYSFVKIAIPNPKEQT
jgi:hypothetical protein